MSTYMTVESWELSNVKNKLAEYYTINFYKVVLLDSNLATSDHNASVVIATTTRLISAESL